MAGKTWRMPPLPKKVEFKPSTIDFESKVGDAEVSVSHRGASSLIANLTMLPQACINAAGRELSIIGHEIIVDAQDNYVPIDKGDLKDSGDSDEWTDGSAASGLVKIAMWFGGEVAHDAPAALHLTAASVKKYALEQHENLELHHPPLRDRVPGMHGQYFRPGGPKYLEKPFDAKQEQVLPRISAAIAESLGTGLNPAFVQFALTDPVGE